MSDSFLDKVLRFGAYFEFIQAARLLGGTTTTAEFQPMLVPAEATAKDVKYRKLMALFTMILGVSRYATYSSKNKSVMKLTLVIHVMEFLFFYSEFKAVKTPTLKMKAFMGVLTVIPTLLLLNIRRYPKQLEEQEKKK